MNMAMEVVQEAYGLRELWEPSRHGILRQPSSLGPNPQTAPPQRQAWKPFEPTAFLYAFTAFNSLYIVDWDASLTPNSYGVLEHSGDEERKIKKFVDYTLIGEPEQRFFINRFRAVGPIKGKPLIKIMEDLLEFRNRDGSPSDLKAEIVTAAVRLGPNLPSDILIADAKALMKGVYQVRCNIVHGRKRVLDLTDHDPQVLRIAAFRQITVALLDTFFYKVKRSRPWDAHPEIYEVDETAQDAVPESKD